MTAEMVGDDDEESIKICRELLRYLPSNYREKPPMWERNDEPDRETMTHENEIHGRRLAAHMRWTRRDRRATVSGQRM